VEKTKEHEVASLVLEKLKRDGWRVYTEVQPHMFGRVADIIATRNADIFAIECKVNPSFDLLAQATEWKDHADLVSVAVPYARQGRGREYFYRLCRKEGFGLFEIFTIDGTVSETIEPRRNSTISLLRGRVESRLALLDSKGASASAIAGAAGGAHLTPWKLTVRDFKDYVRDNPGCSIVAAVSAIQHHYSNDRNAVRNLRRGIHTNMIKGMKMRSIGKAMHVWLSDREFEK
jgi:hypothetical protein